LHINAILQRIYIRYNSISCIVSYTIVHVIKKASMSIYSSVYLQTQLLIKQFLSHFLFLFCLLPCTIPDFPSISSLTSKLAIFILLLSSNNNIQFIEYLPSCQLLYRFISIEHNREFYRHILLKFRPRNCSKLNISSLNISFL